ncbi:60S ribosomal protein [Histoplasma capsulatum var. duboisii H88]|uniref:Large ribosomal subunit protein bL27m n=1 Tax=Ajellomyces capsulatus (strain H88) TaxID=544711 RepID=F0UQC5_AJEC8|nr:60S ribosomal protein [Histoplasma capsulatum var. duboisii H88]QSS53295.1 60S ribosomal protein L2 [Histoplasma capsulatum var. duboisii H88]
MIQPRFNAPLRVLDFLFTPSTSLLSTQQTTRSLSHLSRRTASNASSSKLFCPSMSGSSVLQQRRHSQPQSRPTILRSQLQVRYASHASQGRANNGPKNGPGKRLGAKKSGDQFVIPGNIIFRQRGSKWFPGENCGMGRDHTIYSLATGYVKYYTDPERHPNRKYIGVAFDKSDKFPLPRNAITKRRLGMVAVPRDIEQEKANKALKEAEIAPTLRPGYMYRVANWQIGRVAERAGVRVPEWNKKDRFAAWRRRMERRKIAAQLKDAKSRRKGKKNKA